MTKAIFEDRVFFFKVNLPFKEKRRLKSVITANGGSISFVLNHKCTHCIVNTSNDLSSSHLKKIDKYQIDVVKIDSIWKSIQNQETLPPADFSIVTSPVKTSKEQLQGFLKNLPLSESVKDKEDIPERTVSDDEVSNFAEDAEVAKYCFLQKVQGKDFAIVELLCSSQVCHPYSFRISTRFSHPTKSQVVSAYELSTAEKACEKYEKCINDLKKKGFIPADDLTPQAVVSASRTLQKVLLEEAIHATKLSPEVRQFVESMWVDALGHLDNVLRCPVNNISLNDVSKAEGILLRVGNALHKAENPDDIRKMMTEFYRLIPHKEHVLNNIDKKMLSKKQDLCQLIRDMVNISETNLHQHNPSCLAKYQALRCRIEHVDQSSDEFLQVKKQILESNHSDNYFDILNIYRIGRLSEATDFHSKLGNIKPLLHASSARNFVGILSRGLLLPKVIVEDHGLQRTDIGNLGSGIYFSDSISTSVKYTEPSENNGARLLAVCDVALGTSKKLYKRDFSITEAPNGYHSVHGVRQVVGDISDFKDDEFVVYNKNQVKLKYVVQFCTNEDQVNFEPQGYAIEDEQIEEDVGKDLLQADEPMSENLPPEKIIKGGLQGVHGKQIPLEGIHVKARVMDFISQVVVFQTYKNNSIFPIEAKYVFPLDSTAAVCGFEAFINGKHIVGEVKEKEQAHEEYRTAISEGHGAYLMDQDAPDVFTVSVGNLPANATVIIKITYITELEFNINSVKFFIPGTLASWQQDKALKENTQDSVAKVFVEEGATSKGSFCLDMSIEMPYEIESIRSHTHDIKIKKTDCKAVIQTENESSLDDSGFHLAIYMKDMYLPRMWVEKHPDHDSEACMLVFQPQFQSTEESGEVTICLDCSNSMASSFQDAKLLALHAVNALFLTHKINLIVFGTRYKEFDLYPKLQNNTTLEKLKKFIRSAKPNMGNTELWKPLHSLSLLAPSTGVQKILLISDGHIQNESPVFQVLKRNVGKVQLFTCGVGGKANRHMLRSLSQYGAGAFEFFEAKSKSSWSQKLYSQIKRMESPACHAVSVKWKRFNVNAPEPVQAPTNIQALFCGERLLVYGFVSDCTQATLKALINDQELETMVSTTKLQKTTGTMLHKLTARAIIKDYEDGILHEKENEHEMKKQQLKTLIIELSKEYSIVTQFTSFVAVEKRDSQESLHSQEANVAEIISAENIDFLPYMEWETSSDDLVFDCLSKSVEDRWTGLGELEEPEKPEDLEGLEDLEDLEGLAGLERLAGLEECEATEDRSFTGERGGSFESSSSSSSFDSNNFDCNYLDEHPIYEEEETYAQAFMAPSSVMFKRQSSTSSVPIQPTSLDGFGAQAVETTEQNLLDMAPSSSALFGSPSNVQFQGFSGFHSQAAGINIGMAPPCVALKRSQISPPKSSLFSGFGAQAVETTEQNLLDMAPSSSALFGRPSNVPFQGFSGFHSQAAGINIGMASPFVALERSQISPPKGSLFSGFGAQAVETTKQKLLDKAPSSSALFGRPINVPLQDLSGFGSQAAGINIGMASPCLAQKISHISPPKGSLFSGFGAVAEKQAERCMFGATLSNSAFSTQSSPVRFPAHAFGTAAKENAELSLLARTPTNSSSQSIPFHFPVHLSRGAVAEKKAEQPLSDEPLSSLGLYLRQSSPVEFPALPDFGAVVEKTTKLPLSDAAPSSSGLFGSQSSPATFPAHGFGAVAEKQTEMPLSAIYDSQSRPLQVPKHRKKEGPVMLSHFDCRPLPAPAFLGSRFKELTVPPPPPPPPPGRATTRLMFRMPAQRRLTRMVPSVSWESLSALQSKEGYWMITPALGALLDFDATYLTDVLLIKKGICSLGSKGKEEVLKLIATLLVLQILSTFHLLDLIIFKSLLKLNESSCKSPYYQNIEKAIKWARKADQQHTGICIRLDLGKDWDSATRKILRI